MTRREIASLAIKLMGVFVLLKSIAFVPMVFSGMFVLVIVLSDKAAVWLIKEDNSIENTNTSISKEDVMVIAVSCIGLYFIVAAMPMLITAFLNNAVYMRRQMGSPFIGPSGLMNIFRNLIAPAVQIALGVWLFAGSKGIVKFWKRIRS
jgi:hypothetical protein